MEGFYIDHSEYPVKEKMENMRSLWQFWFSVFCLVTSLMSGFECTSTRMTTSEYVTRTLKSLCMNIVFWICIVIRKSTRSLYSSITIYGWSHGCFVFQFRSLRCMHDIYLSYLKPKYIGMDHLLRQ